MTMENVLDFERHWWRHAGVKIQAIREVFGKAVTETNYYTRLNEIIDSSEAMEIDPILVKRLRRLRVYRQRAKAARVLSRPEEPRP